MQAKIETLKAKDAQSVEYLLYPRTLTEGITSADGKTLEEVVEELNACAGQDCYGCDWQFIIEDGKIYNTWEAFQFV